MAEEFVFAPTVDAPRLPLTTLVAAFAHRGYESRIDGYDQEMCWLQFLRFKSRCVLSTSPDAEKEVGLVTFEYSLSDPDEIAVVAFDVLDSLGFSNEPDAQYR